MSKICQWISNICSRSNRTPTERQSATREQIYVQDAPKVQPISKNQSPVPPIKIQNESPSLSAAVSQMSESQQSAQSSTQNNSPAVQQPKPPAVLASKNKTIIIRLINDIEREVTVSTDITGQELKRYIYDNLSKQLDLTNMSLYYEGSKITKTKKLSELNIVVPGAKLKVIQTKIDIADVPNIIADIHGEDPLTDEKGVAKMSCGHYIGRDSMTALIRSLISENKYQIRCPNRNEQNLPCNTVWDFKLCKNIGIFTKTEMNEFEEGLSKNWIKEFGKECPKCKCSISKIGLETNRVRCPKCKYGDFCYLCLSPWKGVNSTYCGSQTCIFRQKFLTDCLWNRKFSLKMTKEGGRVQQFCTPQYRSCPHCSSVIENYVSCKHTPCKNCSKSFCWVCLALPNNGKWPCGSYNEYCGKVAQVQRTSIN